VLGSFKYIVGRPSACHLRDTRNQLLYSKKELVHTITYFLCLKTMSLLGLLLDTIQNTGT
jgi:hypothetical protein